MRKIVTGSSSDPTCYNCRSDEFYEDDQGGMICVQCGTQSQDFLAEDFDDDDMAVYGGGMGNVIAQRNETSKRKTNKSKNLYVPETLDALKIYQFCLQMLFNAALKSTNVNECKAAVVVYRNTIKQIWMSYISAWGNAASNCNIASGFLKGQIICSCKQGRYSHPLYPSKPLLLGFVYLTYRIMRSAVLPSDLVRYCESGQIPYSNLWENIPHRWKDSVKGSMKWFFSMHSPGQRRFITANSILFHACSIAESIRMVMPKLNAPLVAHRIVQHMGLPQEVWILYTKITQLFTTATPLQGTDMYDQHYPEHVMATLIIACKFCPSWTEWQLLKQRLVIDNNRDDDLLYSHGSANCRTDKQFSRQFNGGTEDAVTTDNINSSNDHHHHILSMPECIADLAQLPRRQLPQLLAQIRRISQQYVVSGEDRRSQAYQLNAAVQAALSGEGGSSSVYPMDDSDEVNELSDNIHNKEVDGKDKNRKATRGRSYQYSNEDEEEEVSDDDAGNRGGDNDAYHHHRRPPSTAPSWKAYAVYDDKVKLSRIVQHSESLLLEDLSLPIRRRIAYLHGCEPHITRADLTNANKSAYIAYSRHGNDLTSLHHSHYTTLLLERCAKYLQITPQLLHNLVAALDAQLVALAFDGTTATATVAAGDAAVTDVSNEKYRLRNNNLLLPKKIYAHNRSSASSSSSLTTTYASSVAAVSRNKLQKNMRKYRKRSLVTLPVLHSLGQSGLLIEAEEACGRSEKDGNVEVFSEDKLGDSDYTSSSSDSNSINNSGDKWTNKYDRFTLFPTDTTTFGTTTRKRRSVIIPDNNKRQQQRSLDVDKYRDVFEAFSSADGGMMPISSHHLTAVESSSNDLNANSKQQQQFVGEIATTTSDYSNTVVPLNHHTYNNLSNNNIASDNAAAADLLYRMTHATAVYDHDDNYDEEEDYSVFAQKDVGDNNDDGYKNRNNNKIRKVDEDRDDDHREEDEDDYDDNVIAAYYRSIGTTDNTGNNNNGSEDDDDYNDDDSEENNSVSTGDDESYQQQQHNSSTGYLDDGSYSNSQLGSLQQHQLQVDDLYQYNNKHHLEHLSQNDISGGASSSSDDDDDDYNYNRVNINAAANLAVYNVTCSIIMNNSERNLETNEILDSGDYTEQ